MDDARRIREPIHDLLPWHMNGTLGREESATFLAHLEGCGPCRREIEALGALRDEIERHGEAFFSDHPTAETLVAAALLDPDLPAARASEVRRHLALCSDCALETRWVVEGQEAVAVRGAAGAARAAPATRRGVGWAAAAALVVLAGGALIVFLQPRGGGATQVVTPFFVDSVQRDPAPASVVVPGGRDGFHLLLHVDVEPASLPLFLDVRDAAGGLVHREDRVESLYRGAYLFVHCDRADFPDGNYLARVGSAAGPALAPREYRFRVVSAR
jgi:hypothetical protein